MDSTTDAIASDNKKIAKASGTIMFAFVIGQVIGFAYNVLSARQFGTSMEMDAFFTANKFPDILYQLVAGGALASAFIPTFTGLLSKGDRTNGWKLASAVINLVTLILLVVGVISAIFAPWIVRNILVPGFTDPVKFQLTVDLLRIQLIAPVIFGVSGLSMGILNSHQKFLWPALAPAMYSVGKIIGVIFLAPSMGAYGLAIGAVVGALLHCLVQVPALLRLPERKYSLTLGLDLPEVRNVARLMGPRLLGVAFVQLNFMVNYNLSSHLGDGPLSAINNAFTLMMILEIVIAQSIAIAAFPTFSAQVANGKKDEMRLSLSSLLRSLMYLTIPASVGMVLLRVPIVSIVYQYGKFDATSTQLVAWALLFYGIGLVGFSVVEIVSRAFYALHDTKTPVLVGVATMIINIGLSFLFLNLFPRWGWMPHGGLALSMTAASFLEMAILLIYMRKKLSGLDGVHLFNGLFKALLASGIMALAVWGWLTISTQYSKWVIGLAGIAIGVLVYIMGLIILRVPELITILRMASKITHRLGGRKTGEA
ncbi:MAG: murein biosynthesis integral membrane protein MurJ [Chloroflexi bacterium HGW-Chloroflexi-4]|jgi:putative peptidoglycan lipid II flippase|nr:MAG: murein biosynthesis integral membrane protein MurJ [Chloroflexi bacterium HGW-Chloroflexi-4]